LVAAFRVTPVALLLAAQAACASEKAPNPAWFDQRAAALDAQGTPDLHHIPHGTDATTNPRHWTGVQQEMRGAEAELRADPRGTPLPGAPTPNQAASDAKAQHDLDPPRSHY